MDRDFPAVIYQDSAPAVGVAYQDRNMTDVSRQLDIRIWKLRERLDMQLCELQLCRTYDMQADYQSKSLPLRMHRYFRDNVAGYALLLLNNPDRVMPSNCITYTELISILNEFGARDEATHTKAIEVKAKRDEEKRKTRRRKWATKAPEIVRDSQGNSVHGSKPDRSKKKRSSAMARL